MEKEPVTGEVTQKDIDELLIELECYLPLYDALDLALRDEWDKVEAEAIGAETDPTLKKSEVFANLRKFLDVLSAKIKKEEN